MIAHCLAKTKEIDRDQWLEYRKRGIGGSDAAAIAGLNKWKSPVTVWLEKTGQIEPEESSEAAYWGSILEDIIAKEFSLRTGLKVQRKNAILQHPEYPFMIGNIDRLIIDKKHGNGILECKTTGEYNKGDWEGDKIPDHYLIQVQHYLAVTGLQYAYIAVLIGGNKFQYKLVPRDEEIIQYLIKIESDFWKLVESRTPPEMDGSQASADLLDILYPNSLPDSRIELPPDAEKLITEYEEAAAEEKAAAERKEAAANKLKAMLGDYEVGFIGKRKVTWKTVTSARLDTKRLKAEMPDIYSQYCTESVMRRFSIK
ncbi:putative phage-type endonuclease [Carboxydocella sporoproducens DSM 16521]|uniref:Putative phage-type endonuclease n=2 Tax=Carboxydocella TaxID=178898 RepID=A0A1T4QE28_9FIRM|nr:MULTISPECIES: YqaJ viral recombinase family protein [Carboxydocella]AVX21629.1 putative phage-type endonuclease [Carboxydocella thermautotrophica]SKA01847.1 putative phage-type endonuclease [Carboxydocella sporoproducens DSM 16521]